MQAYTVIANFLAYGEHDLRMILIAAKPSEIEARMQRDGWKVKRIRPASLDDVHDLPRYDDLLKDMHVAVKQKREAEQKRIADAERRREEERVKRADAERQRQIEIEEESRHGQLTCANCGRTIGALETPQRWMDHLVCFQCRNLLSEQREGAVTGLGAARSRDELPPRRAKSKGGDSAGFVILSVVLLIMIAMAEIGGNPGASWVLGGIWLILLIVRLLASSLKG